MREFILFTRGVTRPFRLNDLPGQGRMDLIARCVTDSIFISGAIRKDVKVYVVLNGPPKPPIVVTFDTTKLKRAYPDERNIASHIRIALEKFYGEPIESEPGIYVEKKSFEKLLEEKVQNSQVLYMHMKGENFDSVKIKNNVTFILGDNKGIPKQTEKFIEKLGIPKVSIGEIEYLTSQVITIIHHKLDGMRK